MKVTDFTKRALRIRRIRARLKADGWEEVGEGGGKLWELYRGYRYNQEIKEVAIDPGRRSLWIKVGPKNAQA
jgi:hypothetical protein